ncbi:hypothetical protein GCM10023339_41030 [Alloalcanivorax gelatiniphagus]
MTAVAATTLGGIAADRGAHTPDAADAAASRATSFELARSRHSDGVLTRSLDDELGAVSTAVAATRAQIGFDPEQAAAVAAAYADPAERADFEARARDAVAVRRAQAGVGLTETPPPPASYAATPLAYRVDPLGQLGTDAYAVHVLSWITLTSVTAEIKDHFYVGTQLLRWNGDDAWRLTIPAPTLRRDLARQQPPVATPGTPAFTRAGWVLVEGANL